MTSGSRYGKVLIYWRIILNPSIRNGLFQQHMTYCDVFLHIIFVDKTVKTVYFLNYYDVIV